MMGAPNTPRSAAVFVAWSSASSSEGSSIHVTQSVAGGCPTAGLAADIRHQSPAAQAAMTKVRQWQFDRMGDALPEGDAADTRRAAIGIWAAMVGAVILARATDDPALSAEILLETRAWIEDRTNSTPAP
jgi:TetR/AcrR family transcriptional regulator, transcriptional repressor for nem operon